MRVVQHQKMTFIYALTDPRTDMVRYIGKSNTPQERFKRHVGYQLTDATYKSRWLRGLIAEGLLPILSIVAEVPAEDWTAHERKWIAHYREVSGESLTNGTAGGDGAWGLTEEGRLKKVAKMLGSNNPFYGKSHPPELQKRIYDQNRGEKNFWFGTHGPMGGRKHTDEAKRLISENNKGKHNFWRGKTQSDEHKAKVSAALKGRPKSEEARKNMSKAQRTKPDEYYRELAARRRPQRKGYKLSEETKTKMSVAARNRKAGHYEKMVETRREKKRVQDVVCELFSKK